LPSPSLQSSLAAARSEVVAEAGPPVLDVVIVSYRSRELLRACLQSLSDFPPYAAHAVYVVDNASGDGTVEMLRADFPEVNLIASERNLGFSAANNTAIRGSRGRYVLVLNPDTRLSAGALDTLLGLMEARPEIGICGCRLVREDGSFDHASRRSFPTIAGALGHFLRIGRSEWAPKTLQQYRAPEIKAGPVDAVNGAFMIIRRAALREVGLFDEGYWMYMEDLDLCYRFRGAGWTTWYEPSITVIHAKGGSSGRIRGLPLNVAFHFGMLRFYRKHYAADHSRLVNAIVYGGIGMKLGIAIAHAEIRRLWSCAGSRTPVRLTVKGAGQGTSGR
jgi:N-acetylglucosaminyl-diphospho-decaprenol L-rhamnosyltransferase